MNSTVLPGIAAGAAGTTVLNAVGYLDMVARSRPASPTLVAPGLDRIPPVLLGLGAGLAANIGTTGPMVATGVTDPRECGPRAPGSPTSCRTWPTGWSPRPRSA